MPDEQNFLQAMYKEQCDQARQHENLRQQSTTLVLTLCSTTALFATASASWLGTQFAYTAVGAILVCSGLLIVALGWFGRVFSMKHYERNRMHAIRAGSYRKELEVLFSTVDYGRKLRDAAAENHLARWKKETSDKQGLIVKAHLYQSWLAIYGFVVVLGMILLISGVLIAAFWDPTVHEAIAKMSGS